MIVVNQNQRIEYQRRTRTNSVIYPRVSSGCVDQSDVPVRWVSPQLMLTSVVMVMGSPFTPPPHLRPLLLWRRLIWVRHEAPLSRKNEQILPAAGGRNGNLSWHLMSGTRLHEY